MTAIQDQATLLRTLVRRQRQVQTPRPPARRASVLAITSGKGGVGKSNVAVNLAVRLSQAGQRVVLLDADLGLANADVLCNVELPYNIAHVIAGRKQLGEVMVKSPWGFGLIGGASGLARMADLTESDRGRLVASLEEVESQADWLLIDTGAGISPNVLSFTRAADHVLVVTTPEPPAITDAYALIKVLTRDASERRLSLLVNHVRTPGEARVVHQRISRVSRQFLDVSVYDAGFVYEDPSVPQAVRKRVPFVIDSPGSPASACLSQLAGRLARGVSASTESRGFFSRFSRWLAGRPG